MLAGRVVPQGNQQLAIPRRTGQDGRSSSGTHREGIARLRCWSGSPSSSHWACAAPPCLRNNRMWTELYGTVLRGAGLLGL
jgi:hypothetical protein